ncbi:hypothetical protein BDV06DRAFT_183429 [Aspergillus oleicola]
MAYALLLCCCFLYVYAVASIELRLSRVIGVRVRDLISIVSNGTCITLRSKKNLDFSSNSPDTTKSTAVRAGKHHHAQRHRIHHRQPTR